MTVDMRLVRGLLRRAHLDTIEIAARLGVAEADVYNVLTGAEHLRLPRIDVRRPLRPDDDDRPLTAVLLGDPLPGRSALDRESGV